MEDSKGQFKIKFRGVRGSYPVAKSDFLAYGGNTACVEVNVNGHLIILDAGTGLIELGKELVEHHLTTADAVFNNKPMNVNLLLSHIHQDHIQGLAFFKPAHVRGCNINVFGYSNSHDPLETCISELLFSKTFPLEIDDIASNLNIADFDESYAIVLRPDSETPIIKALTSYEDAKPSDEEEVIITAMKSFSHPKSGVLVYKIAYQDKAIVYASDIEGYVGGDKNLSLFARDCDLLIHDSQYTTQDYLSPIATKQGFGHSTFDMAIDVFSQAHAKQLAFYHFEPGYDDFKLAQVEAHYQSQTENCFMAREGKEIQLL